VKLRLDTRVPGVRTDRDTVATADGVTVHYRRLVWGGGWACPAAAGAGRLAGGAERRDDHPV